MVIKTLHMFVVLEACAIARFIILSVRIFARAPYTIDVDNTRCVHALSLKFNVYLFSCSGMYWNDCINM